PDHDHGQRGRPAPDLAGLARPGRKARMNRRVLRRWISNAMVGLMLLAVVIAVLPLFFILANLVIKGAGSLSVGFFTRMPVPVGETGGGVAHAIVGTLIIVGMASLVGLPLGIGAGIYCAEYPGTRLAKITRFLSDVMNGTPSIVVGVFAWTLIVARMKHFSALAGSAALAILMIPMVMRTTEELIKLVPHSLREAALALGYPRWRTTLQIILRTALPGIVTGSLLSVARVAGETAPLLFTALGSQYLGFDVLQPMAALPLTVYQYATGPYEEWHQFAWAAALVLILVVLVLSVGARLATRRRFNLNG
ncbi:MAG TPA: phosphate ABC transporter permease PstA, partial [Gemmatimonadales bacterium]|nr:phosphate ABC transporter permease PstA [Gemmatimonadales bacterium]